MVTPNLAVAKPKPKPSAKKPPAATVPPKSSEPSTPTATLEISRGPEPTKADRRDVVVPAHTTAADKPKPPTPAADSTKSAQAPALLTAVQAAALSPEAKHAVAASTFVVAPEVQVATRKPEIADPTTSEEPELTVGPSTKLAVPSQLSAPIMITQEASEATKLSIPEQTIPADPLLIPAKPVPEIATPTSETSTTAESSATILAAPTDSLTEPQHATDTTIANTVLNPAAPVAEHTAKAITPVEALATPLEPATSTFIAPIIELIIDSAITHIMPMATVAATSTAASSIPPSPVEPAKSITTPPVAPPQAKPEEQPVPSSSSSVSKKTKKKGKQPEVEPPKRKNEILSVFNEPMPGLDCILYVTYRISDALMKKDIPLTDVDKLNESQRNAVKRAFNYHLTIIHGPPGNSVHYDT